MGRSITTVRGIAALAFALALLLAPAPAARAKWRGIAAADSQIVFAGRDFDAYRSSWHYLPFVESAHRMEGYLATWTAPGRRVPVFMVQVQILAPGYYFDGAGARPVEEFPGLFGWFRSLEVVHGETGKADTVLGEADYLVFSAGEYGCAAFLLYIHGAWSANPGAAGTTRLFGLYCPVSGAADGAAVESVLAKIGIREVAVPREEPREATRPGAPAGAAGDDLALLVTGGDMRGLRRRAVAGLDPDAVIAYSHPRFARGREIARPMLHAAALFGHTEIVAFLLDRGASTEGPAAGAICAAIATDRPDIVDLLLEKDPGLGDYGRCGRSGTLSPLQLAMRLGHLDIAEALRKAGG